MFAATQATRAATAPPRIVRGVELEGDRQRGALVDDGGLGEGRFCIDVRSKLDPKLIFVPGGDVERVQESDF